MGGGGGGGCKMGLQQFGAGEEQTVSRGEPGSRSMAHWPVSQKKSVS